MAQRRDMTHLKDKLEEDNNVNSTSEAQEFLQKGPGILDNTPPKIKYIHATYSLPSQVKEDVKALAKALDIPQSTIVTKALEQVIEQYKHLL